MLTKLTIRNFKQFEEVEIELGNPVVFVGPNNSGKTTALQALALWEVGLKRWLEKRGEKAPKKRPGVTINRRDLVSLPVSDAQLLWRDLHVRNVQRTNGKQTTSNINVEILVEGVTGDRVWECGLEFDYANDESFYCRPLRLADDANERMQIPEEAVSTAVAFLPPMSGLAANETRLDPGAVAVRLGEGRTAEVLRNLCLRVFNSEASPGSPFHNAWTRLVGLMSRLFGCELEPPEYIKERGEVRMTYRDQRSTRASLDLSSTGRGFQQTLLLLAHMACNPGTVLLLDEPDAHLEILRQRQLYQTLVDEASHYGCQVIAASHSEVVLNEAADRDVVVAFVGKPHRIDDRGSQLLKSLKEIGFEQYYQAERRGWVLYLEGSTDLAILRAFARKLSHPAEKDLERPFVHYIANQPKRANDHFYGLREGYSALQGFVLCDRLSKPLESKLPLEMHCWLRREIENYLCFPETLMQWAASLAREAGPLFEAVESERLRAALAECIEDLVPPRALRDRTDRWWIDVKATDDFLDRVLSEFTSRIGLPQGYLRKSDYHKLADFVPEDMIDSEVAVVLDQIRTVAASAVPFTG